MAEPIEVVGLAQLSKSLRKVSADAPKALRVAINGVADQLVRLIRPRIPRRSGRAAGSLKASSTRTAARIGVGGSRAPYVPWLDFGGRTGRNRSVQRDFLKEGRYVYPTLKDERPKIERSLGEALVGVATGAGLDVTSG